MTSKKFELTSETKVCFGKTLFRIKALKSFGRVNKGDLGGFIEKESNLDQSGDAWVFGDARIYGDAWVYDNAWVFDNAWVYDNAWVFDNARIYGDAKIYSDAWISGDAQISGDARIYGDAQISSDKQTCWFSKVGTSNGTLTAFKTETGVTVTGGCFIGALEEFEQKVKEVHGDSKIGKEYNILIEFIKLRFDE